MMRLRLFAGAFLLILLAGLPARAVDVQRVVSPGGIEAWLVEDHTNPIISLELAFRGAAALDPPGREGLANLVSGLIDEGAGDLDSQAFQSGVVVAKRASFCGTNRGKVDGVKVNQHIPML